MLVDHEYQEKGQAQGKRRSRASSVMPGHSIRKGNRRPFRAVAAGLLLTLQCSLFVADAGAVTPIQVGSGLTAPTSGIILNGGAINPATNLPYRHLWVPDHLSGVCRMDPDLDSPPPYSLNQNTCLSLNGALKPGQVAFDATNNNLYTVDLTTKSQGLYRLHFMPNGDQGHGVLDQTRTELITSLAGGCGLGGSVPIATSIGPDGALYIGFKKGGNITRIKNPGTDPIPCGNYQNIGSSPDGKLTLGMGWIGRTLYGIDGLGLFSMDNADTCQGNCRGASMLTTQIPVPSALISDQNYPATTGGMLYLGTPNTVARVNLKSSPMSVEPTYGTGLSFVSGLAVDSSSPGNAVLYAADDPTNGAGVGSGRLWRLADPPATPVPPSQPTGVSGVVRDSAVVLSWKAGASGTQPVTSYTINSPQWGSSRVESVGIVPPATSAPTSATITGLSNGTPYDFTVTANSTVGSSAPSALAGPFTPQAATVPAAPTNVSAIPGNASASLAWSAPALDGNSPITGYRIDLVTLDASGNPATYTPAATAPGNATGATVFGLTNGSTYNFAVEAQNIVGFSPPSAPLAKVTLNGTPNTDLAISMNGPASVTPGSNAVYTATVINNGPVDAGQIIFTDSPPPSGATLVSATTTAGACNTTAWPISCNLGAVPARGSATVTVTLNVSGKISYGAKVQALDGAGNTIPDSTPANNSAAVTTDIAVATTSTDLQLGGSAKVGGPAKGSSDTYTWQVKNVGKSEANAVVFSNDFPSSLQINGPISISGAAGTCSMSPGALNGTLVTCSVNSLGSAQSVTITENVTVLQSGSIATTGAVKFSGTDTNPKNDSVTVTIQAK
ncbi:fibronectin type III domain-containing protein [Noviherbaspirillum soli]|uniref:fibronectin type III domain-containing protein n=1 Tax=Noviherbaspirillum soli TaxID=1064518 RepID=UPI00188A6C87|nr:fibronectin type III domain-containing protein [Noviherbaspirillum soli]